MNRVFWCSSCLAMSTRNRISFNKKRECNACQWKREKETIDWSIRKNELSKLLDIHRSKNGEFDCIVPVSGGKDGSYVAYNLKHNYGMNPLCITVTPPLQLELGKKNLENFINSDYTVLSINTNPSTMKYLNKRGLCDIGFPYYGWLVAIQTIPVRFAIKLGIDLIFYGEDGEVEYGGSTETAKDPIYGVDYMKKVYLENSTYGSYKKILDDTKDEGFKDLDFFKFPDFEKTSNLKITHWSYFENWDPYRNYIFAKEHCGLEEAESNNLGTFTNFAQNDQAFYALHTYLMFLKYGFGRANQDACIEIRRGAMSRDQAINLVRLYDGHKPNEYKELYLEYFEMTESDFEKVLDKWANKDVLSKESGEWKLIEEIT